MIDFITGLLALAYFALISAATKQHFVSEKFPLGMHVISVISLIGLFTFLVHAFSERLHATIAVIPLILVAVTMFLWAVKHSRSEQLSLAFDTRTTVKGIITSGPWKYVRHPFYTSYIVFWLACALGTRHPTSIIVLIALSFIYGYSAMQEEASLSQGKYGNDYRLYQKNARFFLPKLFSRS